MLAYIIYHKEEAVKNSGFIKMFQTAGQEYDITFLYVSYDSYKTEKLPDFVMNRTREKSVSEWYEKRKVPVFHSSFITETGNHKFLTLKYLEKHLSEEIKMQKWKPDTCFVSADEIDKVCTFFDKLNKQNNIGEIENDTAESENLLEKMTEHCSFLGKVKNTSDKIIKSVDGHGGSEVFLISNSLFTQEKNNVILNEKISHLKYIFHSLRGHDCVIQEKIDSDSQDIRVYVVAGQIYAAVLRKGGQDFRSNFSLGGSVCLYELSPTQKDYVNEFIKAFGKDRLFMVGIDFLYTKDKKLIFNELEEMVGSRMLYQCSEYDIVKDSVRCLSQIETIDNTLAAARKEK